MSPEPWASIPKSYSRSCWTDDSCGFALSRSPRAQLFIANISDEFFGLHERETPEYPLPPGGALVRYHPPGGVTGESRCIGFPGSGAR